RIHYAGLEDVSLNMEKLQAVEKCGFSIEKFHSDIAISKNAVKLNDLLFLSGNGSRIRESVIFGFPSLEEISDNPGKLSLDIRLSNSNLALADIFYFDSSLTANPYLKKNQNLNINVDVLASGSMENLDLRK